MKAFNFASEREKNIINVHRPKLVYGSYNIELFVRSRLRNFFHFTVSKLQKFHVETLLAPNESNYYLHVTNRNELESEQFCFYYIRSTNKFLAELFWCSCNLHFLKHQTFLDNRLRRNQTQAQLTQKKSQLKADKFKNAAKEFSFSIRVVENVVDAFDIFCAPGLQRIGRGDSAVRRHLIHDVARCFSRCMRCRFASTLLRCIIVSRLLR